MKRCLVIIVASILFVQTIFAQNTSNAFVTIKVTEQTFPCLENDEVKVTFESSNSPKYQLVSKQIRIHKAMTYVLLLEDLTGTGTYKVTTKTVKDDFVFYEGKVKIKQEFLTGTKAIFSLNLGGNAPLCQDLAKHKQQKELKKKEVSKAYFEIEIDAVAWAKKCHEDKKIKIEYDLDDLNELEFGSSELVRITNKTFRIYLPDMQKIKGQYKFKVLDEQDKIVMAEMKFMVTEAHFAGAKPIMSYRLGEANLCK